MKKIFLMLAVVFGMFSAFGSLERDVDFIYKYAPVSDLPLDGAYVTNNCKLAAIARVGAIEKYPDEIYLDYVLPYSVIHEDRDDWREEFRERFLPLIEGCQNNYEAAVKLDRTIWDIINVHYDTRRDKARQSPRHSMRIGMASCTGISIILIEACRALGIPARLVGCCWTTIPGNHSWVEVWSGGRWRVLASGEKEREDDIWFLDYAEKADASKPGTRIYASRWSTSPEGVYFWKTLEWPRAVSDVPADDVTAKYAARSKYAIVISPKAAQDSEWSEVAVKLAEKHSSEADVGIIAATPAAAKAPLASEKPRYVAFVMMPDEFNADTILELKAIMRNLDDDPFDDAIWGIVTGPDATTARRIASSNMPKVVSVALATTGVGEDVVPGPVAVLPDCYPEGNWWIKRADGTLEKGVNEGEVASVFAAAWDEFDPDFILTSSHASERNIEMAFSRGTIVAKDGRFVCCDNIKNLEHAKALKTPTREKIWLAAGNCLIANHIDSQDMIMSALSFGKVNQFVGYFKTTWFGFIGWNTWRYFRVTDMSLAESYFAANQWLIKKLEDQEWASDFEKMGLEWDKDATIFYGDPMQRVTMPHRENASPDEIGDAPYFVIFPDSKRKRPVDVDENEYEVFKADDFAIIKKHSNKQ